MTEQDTAQADETAETTAQADETAETAETTEQAEPADSGMAGAVDDRATELTGSAGAASTDAPVADNRGAVAQAEEHLEDTNPAADRETLKELQKDM